MKRYAISVGLLLLSTINALAADRPVEAISTGLKVYRNLDLDEADIAVTSSPSLIYGYFLYNGSASARYFKFYNATAANVTVATTNPVLTIALPAGAAANVSFDWGIAFSTAITAACTTDLIEDGAAGAPGANDCVVNLLYK